MKIQNYAVAMSAQHYKLEFQQTQASLSTSTKDFTNDTTSHVDEIKLNQKPLNNSTDELTKELSKAIIKNIHSESQRIVGDSVEISTSYVEAQSLSYQVNAFIQADGKEIELSLDVNLASSFINKTSIEVSINSFLKDPLVISLDGTMPTLSSKTFSFDIDSDGINDQISLLNNGNSFLAFDKNKNGKVDDGSELFGTKSGDGFKDLSRYDDDENGWIDENDLIFDKLRIWQKTDTKDKLIGLGEVGIGAIFLGNTATPFSLKSNSNELLGEIRKSGFVLFENAKAGIASQIDLAVKVKESVSYVEDMQKNLKKLNLDNLYTKKQDNSDDSEDDRMEKLQAKIKALEVKLRKADNADKPAIQAQIGALFAQMMALLETELS